MSKKYKEEMNKIVMNNNMKKRILQNVLATNENNKEKNIKATVPKVKKYNNIKRNMQIIAAGFTVVLCLGIAKNYPMLLNSENNNLKQNEIVKIEDNENNNLKTNDNNELVDNKNSKEVSNNDNKEEQALNSNNNIHKNGNISERKESNASLETGKEEKNKDNVHSNSESEVKKVQTSQNNDQNKVTSNSNISSKTNPEEDINNKENKNTTSTETQTYHGDIEGNKISESDTDNDDSETSVMSNQSVDYSEEYKTLDEAEKALNLKVNSLKTVPKGFKMENISVISNEIIQVKYNNGNSNITLRVGKGIDNISGDYNDYQIKKTVKVNGINVNLEGNKSEKYNLALWEIDNVSYSISTENGIDEKTILDMIL